MRKKEEKKLGKNVKRHIAFPVLMAIITVFVMGVCFFPYLPLKDGTFIKSVLKGLHGVAKNYLGFYFPDDLNIPVLAPFALYSLINLVYAIFGVNVVFWILDACIFEGLYLFCAWYYIDDRAGQLALFGRVPYELVGFALAGLGILFLAAIVLSKLIKKIRNREKKVKEKRSTEAENSNVSAKDSDEPAITHKEAVSALRSTELPEFRNYPNCFDGLPEIPVGGNIYESAFAEGEMRRNAEKRREEENEKKFARLESIFSLKNIRDRVIAERVDDDGFSEYHGDMDIDIQPSDISVICDKDNPCYKTAHPTARPVPSVGVVKTADGTRLSCKYHKRIKTNAKNTGVFGIGNMSDTDIQRRTDYIATTADAPKDGKTKTAKKAQPNNDYLLKWTADDSRRANMHIDRQPYTLVQAQDANGDTITNIKYNAVPMHDTAKNYMHMTADERADIQRRIKSIMDTAKAKKTATATATAK